MIMSISRLATERARRREIRLRQLEQDRDLRVAAVESQIPRLADIRSMQSEIGLDIVRLMLKTPTRFGKDFEELKDWSAELNREKSRLLGQHKISPAELEIHYDCPDCKDTGWLEPEPAGHDTVHPPHKCHCLIQQEIEDLYRAAGLSGRLREQVFENFDLMVYPAKDRSYMAKVLDYCKTYAQNLATGEPVENLLLLGEVGRGKTFLASAISNAAVSARRSVVYFTFSEFLDLLRLNRIEDDQEYRAGVQRLLEADLIVLDDLGAEKVTEFAGQELFNIINQRLNRTLPIVVSTNLTHNEIEDSYGERIASRLLNGFFPLPLKGDDVRLVLRRRRIST